MRNRISRIAVILAGMLLFTGCSPSQPGATEDKQPDTNRLGVAAYNVRYGRNGTAEEIGKALAKYDLDIVCFSEAPGGDWTKEAAHALDMNHIVVGQFSTAGHEDKYKTIASRTPLYGYEEILMGDTLHTATKALTKIGGNEIAIYSVHFPRGWRDQAHIDETTWKITEFIDKLRSMPEEEIALVMGDFNFVPSNDEDISMYHEMFADAGLDMSWRDLEIDIAKRNTSRALDPGDENRGHVIDHIMYDPAKVRALDGGIVELETPLSDHKPVWALLEVK